MLRPDRLTAQEIAVLEASGWGQRQGFGTRPVVLVVDVTYGFTGDRPEPILEAIKRYPTSCGEVAWPALDAMETLLAAARRSGMPIVYTRNEYREDGKDLGSWAWKMTRDSGDRASAERANRIVDRIAPRPEDIVIAKKKPSAFFGTPLVSYLTDLGADQLIVVGCVTSGCVRATVVDAFSYNLRVAVVREGTFDRIPLSHEMALFELDAKYADVVSLAEAIRYVEADHVVAGV
ncbi:MAG TPA: isochorismatase family protein [Trueperaceae bacterium]|jgi:nicotinamidase-related amidase